MTSLAFCAAVQLTACSSPNPSASSASAEAGADYFDLLEARTSSAQVYEGFYNTMDVKAGLLTGEVVQAQFAYLKKIYQWDDAQYMKERDKALIQIQKETEVFLSFFVPEKKHDDINKKTTTWRVFLDVEGRRYEGVATKLKNVLADQQALYPFHTRWATGYKIKFPIAAVLLDKTRNVKMTVTGTLGSAQVEFK